ncbi:O-antigen ligase family protein [Plantibacter sp. RU18]|uniref:O-antigen ligase family protein n=1 Tax=Plantibacter sp. RU18 TaxID=3158143 RepID=UPI003D367234
MRQKCWFWMQDVRAAATWGLFVAFAGTTWTNVATIWGYAVVAFASTAYLIAVAARRGVRGRLGAVPWALLAYIGLAVVSLFWSAYRVGTAVTLLGMLLCTTLGVIVALCLSWDEIFAAVRRSAFAVIMLSLVFELVVALFIRQPVLPFFTAFGTAKPPVLAYWSRGLLFDGGRIQGIVGNANLLAFVAAVALILFLVRLVAARRKVVPLAGVIVTLTTLWVTFSTTVLLGLLAAAVVVAAVVSARMIRPRGLRYGFAVVVVGVATVVALGALRWSEEVLAVLGKSSDLTGRTEIWGVVWQLVQESPVVGWGFASPWAGWEPVFSDLAVRNGVRQLQAHNAWLDVWLQLGVFGLIVFVALIGGTLYRAIRLLPHAYDRSGVGAIVVAAVPLTLTVFLISQTITESRILFESGWVLLTMLATKTALDQPARKPIKGARRPASGAPASHQQAA